jgi:hypothetical protein
MPFESVIYLVSFPVVTAEGPHPISFRTRKLSPPAPMVLHGYPCGRVGHCRNFTLERGAAHQRRPALFFVRITRTPSKRWACSSAWLERTPDKREVGSSSLPRPTRFSSWGRSSVGRALPLQGRCRRFDSVRLHSLYLSRKPGRLCCRLRLTSLASPASFGT